MINNKHVSGDISFWYSTPHVGVADVSLCHLPGLPNNPFPIPGITEFITEFSNIIQPQYYGTYDSGGVFSPESSHEIVRDLRKFSGQVFRTAKKQSEQLFPDHIPVLSSHSFGTFVGMQYLLSAFDNELPQAAFFFAPMISYGDDARKSGITLDLELQADFVTRCFPGTFRLPSDQCLGDFFKKRFVPSNEARIKKRVKCYFIYGENDPLLNFSDSMRFNEEFVDSVEHLEVADHIVVEGAGHDIPSMLNDLVKTALRKELVNAE